MLSLICSFSTVGAPLAYSQTDPEPAPIGDGDPLDNINFLEYLADQTLLYVLFTAGAAVSLRIYMGMVRNHTRKLNYNSMALTFILSLLTSVGLVATNVETLPGAIPPLQLLTFTATQIMAVAMADKMYKDVRDIVGNRKDKQSEFVYDIRNVERVYDPVPEPVKPEPSTPKATMVDPAEVPIEDPTEEDDEPPRGSA